MGNKNGKIIESGSERRGKGEIEEMKDRGEQRR